MNRETKTITLPKTKKEVEVYTYITAGEKRKINEILTNGISSDINGKAQGEIALSTVYLANDKALELLVRNLTLAEVNELPSVDHEFLMSEINLITNENPSAEKKTV